MESLEWVVLASNMFAVKSYIATPTGMSGQPESALDRAELTRGGSLYFFRLVVGWNVEQTEGKHGYE
jgi:hypothetical protein